MLVHNRMAKHSRRSHKRSAHRKGSRKTHRKGSRKTHRRSRRVQRGGDSCMAMPRNFASFQQQRGGMAPFVAGDNYLLDQATRVQAEVAPLDKAFAELPSVIRTQAGGRRRKSRRAGRKGRRSAHRRHGRKSHHKGRRSAHRRQRGGMSPFDAPGMLLDKGAYAADGTNPQFRTEGTVNSLYGEFKGAQA